MKIKKFNFVILGLWILLLSNCQNDDFIKNNEKSQISQSYAHKVNLNAEDCNESTSGYYFSKPLFAIESRNEKDFIWGINGHSLRQPNPTTANPYYSDVTYEETLNHLKALGVSMYRNEMHVGINGELRSSERSSDLNKLLDVFTKEEGIEILPMIFGNKGLVHELISIDSKFNYSRFKKDLKKQTGVIPVRASKETVTKIKRTKIWRKSYREALTTGKNFALNHNNWVDRFNYYNISNEIAYKIIADTEHPKNNSGDRNTQYFYKNIGGGTEMEHFFTAEEFARKTISSCAYIKGLIDGIRQIDTDAKFIVNFTKAHYGFLKFLSYMRVRYDIVGWNWYSVFGEFDNAKGIEGIPSGDNVYDKLTRISKGKPIWVTECNFHEGGSNNNNKPAIQAKEIRTIMEQMYQLPNVKAHILYELYDGGSNAENAQHNFGLMRTPPRGDFTYKPGFNSYRYSIEEFKYGYHDFMHAYYLLYKGENRNIFNDNGINSWSLKFKNGLDIDTFTEKNLDLDSDYFVNQTFDLLLNKSPNESAKNYYKGRLIDGLSREWLISDIASSNDFLTRAQKPENGYDQSSPINNFIYHVYKKLLNRSPESSELIVNIESLNNRNERRAFVSNILNTEEYIRFFINENYNKYFNRDAEPSGSNYHFSVWKNQRHFLLNTFKSDEFWRKSIVRGYCERKK